MAKRSRSKRPVPGKNCFYLNLRVAIQIIKLCLSMDENVYYIIIISIIKVMKVLQGVVAEDSEEDHEALGEAVEEAVEEEDVEVEGVAASVVATEHATIATRRAILPENAQNRTNGIDKPRCCTITEKSFHSSFYEYCTAKYLTIEAW